MERCDKERLQPGALQEFLTVLAGRWTISLFHYHNYGAAYARVLAGFLVPAQDDSDFHEFLKDTGYRFVDETHNAACVEYLSTPDSIRTAKDQHLTAVSL